jgi:hypothetical protein
MLPATCFVFPDPRILLEAVLGVEDLDDVVGFKLAATFANWLARLSMRGAAQVNYIPFHFLK